MTGIVLRPQQTAGVVSHAEVFHCPEESQFYSYCLEQMVFHQCDHTDAIVEFGAGDGSPVINALLRVPLASQVHGYELNPAAHQVARNRIEQCQLTDKYTVYNTSFFDAARPAAQYLVANPPYLPALDNQICMPLLHGGTDGACITNKLLTLDYPNVMVLISSYSNPLETIAWGLKHGYTVADFKITPLPFGYYSSEPKVKNRIAELHQQGQAFYSHNIYFLAGVLFRKRNSFATDLSAELGRVLTAL